MKKMMFLMLLAGSFIIAEKANAQVNINIGAQPAWGPVGYQHVDYYYLPDLEAYYYVPRKQFIYLNNGKWVYSAGLPSAYRSYDLYNGYKVVVNEPKPFLRHATYKVKYAKYKGNNGKQVAIGKGKAKEAGYKAPAQKTVVVKSKGAGRGKSKH